VIENIKARLSTFGGGSVEQRMENVSSHIPKFFQHGYTVKQMTGVD
jgi:hypothetical protein